MKTQDDETVKKEQSHLLELVQKMPKSKPPKIHQFDLFHEYKEMEQLNTMREHIKRPYLENSKAILTSRRLAPVNSLPTIQPKTIGSRDHSASHNPGEPPLPLMRGQGKLSKTRRKSPMIQFRPTVKYRIKDPMPFNPFANKADPVKVYKKAEYLSKLPVNPKVDIEAIEKRIQKLMRHKAAPT